MHNAEALVIRLVQLDLQERVKQHGKHDVVYNTTKCCGLGSAGGELGESMQHAHATYRNASRKLRPADVFVWRLAHSAPAPVHMRDGLEVLQLNADADGEHFVLERAQITCALAAASCAQQLT